jgi:S-adenosylmethionine:tRNA ribosyltransferase-isomerase
MGRTSVTAFELPGARHATEPPEARGLRRDEVRLLVSHLDGRVEHRRFYELPQVLRAGDLLVVNTSGTLSASLQAERADGTRVELHVSTELPGHLWTVELRQPGPVASKPLQTAAASETLRLPADGRATLLAPYPFGGRLLAVSRLWAAALELPLPVVDYLARHGSPIRYEHVPRPWPIADYQTVFATENGSAEMPSAGRPFTRELVAALVDSGVAIAPLVLHTGVSSLETHEPPYEERYRVPRETAGRVNDAHASGRRVIAVGTTVVRALETVTDERGITHPGAGWTDRVIAPDEDLQAVDGLLTGLHEPRATHVSMIRAIARRAGERGTALIDRAYREAVERGYVWHEFGDAHLILP